MSLAMALIAIESDFFASKLSFLWPLALGNETMASMGEAITSKTKRQILFSKIYVNMLTYFRSV